MGERWILGGLQSSSLLLARCWLCSEFRDGELGRKEETQVGDFSHSHSLFPGKSLWMRQTLLCYDVWQSGPKEDSKLLPQTYLSPAGPEIRKMKQILLHLCRKQQGRSELNILLSQLENLAPPMSKWEPLSSPHSFEIEKAEVTSKCSTQSTSCVFPFPSLIRWDPALGFHHGFWLVTPSLWQAVEPRILFLQELSAPFHFQTVYQGIRGLPCWNTAYWDDFPVN